MVKDNDESWVLPRRKPITKDVIERAIATEEEAAHREHQAQEAWFDPQHGTVMLKLTDGRVLGITIVDTSGRILSEGHGPSKCLCC